VETEAAVQLLAAVGGGAVLVSGVAGAIKAIAFPAAWQTGRAPMVLVAGLALALVAATMVQLGLDFGRPETWIAGVSAWLTVYTAAIGVHQTATKATRAIAGTTDTRGPDA
jgi:hypothetical protein